MEPEIQPHHVTLAEILFTHSKIKKIVFCVCALIIILGIASWTMLLLEPKQAPQSVMVSIDEIKDWKTYRNDEYGFEVKIPQDWGVEKSKLFDLDFISSTTRAKIIENEDCFLRSMYCNNHGVISDLNFSGKEIQEAIIGNVESLNLNDVTFKIYLVGGLYEYFVFQTFNDGKMYNFTSVDKNKGLSILSTFKFIEPLATTTIDTSNWKTYENKELGFSFKYPGDYVVEVKNNENAYYLEVFDPVSRKKFYERKDLTDQEFPIIYISPNSSLSSLKGDLAFGVNSSFSFTEEYFKNDRWQTYLGQIIIDTKKGFQFRHCEFNDHKYTIFQNSSDSFFVINTLNTDNVSYCNSKINKTIIEPYDTIIKTFKFNK